MPTSGEQNLEPDSGIPTWSHTNPLYFRSILFFLKNGSDLCVYLTFVFLRNLDINRYHYLPTNRKIETEFKGFSSIDCKPPEESGILFLSTS